MEIVYLGHSSFKLKGKNSTVVTDPYDNKVGKFPRDLEAQIVTVSHDHTDHNQADLIKGTPFVITGPGEYEVGGVSVVGVSSFHDNFSGADRGTNTIFIIEMDNLRVCHLGDLGHKLSDDQLSEIGSIDIVLIPVGGTYTLDARTALEVAIQLDPWVIIPMHYQQPGLDSQTFGALTGVDQFLKEKGVSVEPIAKLTITADKLPSETQVIVLERKV